MKIDVNSCCANPLTSRADIQLAVNQLCSPLAPFFSESSARVSLGSFTTNYGEQFCEMESFARPLWGIGPLLGGGGFFDSSDRYREGILHGTNPEHAEYWGDLMDGSQLAVEMPPIALALLFSPEQFWNPLSDAEKSQVTRWLLQINDISLSDNNWQAFPVIVNVVLKQLGQTYSPEKIDHGLSRLDAFYLGNGWYSDGGPNNRRDYYVPYAFHYYTLIYAKIMETEDPERSARYKERARLFAEDFVHWFTADGAAIPFGRSLTYRFALGAFWGALAFAGVEFHSWGVVKGLFLRHLRWWMKQPIFSSDGLLTVGYGYSNLLMSEFYNGPGSPYWAMKLFLPLALPDSHPFWLAEEEAYPLVKTVVTQQAAYMIVGKSETADHAVALTSGQWSSYDFGHTAEKYAKFAYSTHFGFSVSRESTGLNKGAYDSMLALSDGGDNWRVRRECESFTVEENDIRAQWKPWPDVVIDTWVSMEYPWHIRIHRIVTGRALDTAEGAFAVPFSESMTPNVTQPNGAIAVHPELGGSGILNMFGGRWPMNIEPFPNTNLIHPRTIIPTIHGHLEPGEHWFAAIIIGDRSAKTVLCEWENPPVERVNQWLWQLKSQ